jgi:hypothetical protein
VCARAEENATASADVDVREMLIENDYERRNDA